MRDVKLEISTNHTQGTKLKNPLGGDKKSEGLLNQKGGFTFQGGEARYIAREYREISKVSKLGKRNVIKEGEKNFGMGGGATYS